MGTAWCATVGSGGRKRMPSGAERLRLASAGLCTLRLAGVDRLGERGARGARVRRVSSRATCGYSRILAKSLCLAVYIRSNDAEIKGSLPSHEAPKRSIADSTSSNLVSSRGRILPLSTDPPHVHRQSEAPPPRYSSRTSQQCLACRDPSVPTVGLLVCRRLMESKDTAGPGVAILAQW